MPVTMSSIAFDLPTILARRVVPPVPGSTPRVTSGRPILPASLRAMRRSRGHRDLEAAADRVAVQGRDDELGRVLEAQQRLVGVQAEEVLEAGRDGVQHADVRAGREEPVALAAQDDDVDVVVEAGLQDRLVELAVHRVGVGVGGRIVDLDDRDAVGGAVVDDGVVELRARPVAGLGGCAHEASIVLIRAGDGIRGRRQEGTAGAQAAECSADADARGATARGPGSSWRS